jgi:hypothetical protein
VNNLSFIFPIYYVWKNHPVVEVKYEDDDLSELAMIGEKR